MKQNDTNRKSATVVYCSQSILKIPTKPSVLRRYLNAPALKILLLRVRSRLRVRRQKITVEQHRDSFCYKKDAVAKPNCVFLSVRKCKFTYVCQAISKVYFLIKSRLPLYLYP